MFAGIGVGVAVGVNVGVAVEVGVLVMVGVGEGVRVPVNAIITNDLVGNIMIKAKIIILTVMRPAPAYSRK